MPMVLTAGVTAPGYLNVTFFNERRAIPKTITLSRDEETDASREEVTETIGGVVRELEVGVILDEKTTVELIEWLKNKLVELPSMNELIKGHQGKSNA